MLPSPTHQSALDSVTTRYSKFTKASVFIALVNFLIFAILFIGIFGGDALHKLQPNSVWGRLFFKTSDLCVVILFFYALSVGPLASLCGLCLAIVGSLRPGLRKSLGLLGLICNTALLAVNIVADVLLGLVFIGLHGLSPR